jgi:hypothetical protein
MDEIGGRMLLSKFICCRGNIHLSEDIIMRSENGEIREFL